MLLIFFCTFAGEFDKCLRDVEIWKPPFSNPSIKATRQITPTKHKC